ncbi:ubiquinone/menaquinone biosynthesis methyltransferase [Chloroflexota bacterium]
MNKRKMVYQNQRAESMPLHGMFTVLPPRYDLVNRVITWGQDVRWRRQAAAECLVMKPRQVLDLGCGTGDLAVELARQAAPGVEVTGIDYSQPMLELAARKAARLAPARKLAFVLGEAAELPFPDGDFDCVGISFAFRNLTYKNPLLKQHVAEVFRVLRNGGRFVIVETSQPGVGLIRWLYHRYLHWFVYPLGYLLSGNKGAYRYLVESAARFYTSEELKEILLTAGFSRVLYHPRLFGAVGIHVAIKGG